ncbi:1,4-alpha-glucan branching protein GlgB [Zongyangia hominis]|uniref:1,4-alpha-glucan branching enzyme n=1 Tax=Zongyangia hominis TaxID=2763677 RepID=A0A926IC92_9FIRM|nr:1,4-alpha-glucan branching protein GlgB [Zongyangia hominis]MBC8570870.1 1,4-alpha-glucan branching protein GlgB [Zongyangia hominis]
MALDSFALSTYLHGASQTGYEIFGAHLCREDGQEGARFTVYAPNAARVELIGAFNDWNGWGMKREGSGVWSAFVGGAKAGDLYKYRITTADGEVYDRADPFAFSCERRPNTASIVCGMEGFSWGDGAWMEKREKNYNAPLNIYEVHAGSWKQKNALEDGRFLNYEELAAELIPYVREMGYTHIELMPLTEYPFDGSWGYQVTGYFAPTSRYGTPEQLMRLIDACHQAGIGVILDFVPLHFVRDFFALHLFDGGFLYESDFEDRRYSQWGTALFDFTKPHVLSFLMSSIDFWLSRYHFDGVRYDAVSNLLYHDGDPGRGVNEAGVWFLRSCNFAISQRHPTAMLIAEDSSECLKVTAPVVYGGMGFDYKWSLGWMHDTLDYFALPPLDRERHRGKFVHSMSYFYQDIFILPFSHDEVVHGKRTIIDKLYGDYGQKFDQLRCLYLYMMTHPGKKLNFMGNELAEFKEWDEDQELGWNLLTYPAHDAFWRYFRRLQHLYREEKTLFQEDYNAMGFRWVDQGERYPALFAYERSTLDEKIYVVLNLSDRPAHNYMLGVGRPGEYEVLLDTAEPQYGGKGSMEKVLRTKERGPIQCGVDLMMQPFSGCMIKAK